MTHAELVERAERWLRNSMRCSVVFTEQGGHIFSGPWATGEIPDAIGWRRDGWSILVECKTSMSDFYSDRAKPFRKDGRGAGQERWYMTPRGLIKPGLVRYGWGLCEVRGSIVRKIVQPDRREMHGPPCAQWMKPHPEWAANHGDKWATGWWDYYKRPADRTFDKDRACVELPILLAAMNWAQIQERTRNA